MILQSHIEKQYILVKKSIFIYLGKILTVAVVEIEYSHRGKVGNFRLNKFRMRLPKSTAKVNFDISLARMDNYFSY